MMLLSAFLERQRKIMCCAPISFEATLRVWEHYITDTVLKSAKQNSAKDLIGCIKQRHATAVAKDCFVAFALVNSHNISRSSPRQCTGYSNITAITREDSWPVHLLDHRKHRELIYEKPVNWVYCIDQISKVLFQSLHDHLSIFNYWSSILTDSENLWVLFRSATFCIPAARWIHHSLCVSLKIVCSLFLPNPLEGGRHAAG